MTKKDFKLIAEVLYNRRPLTSEPLIVYWESLCRSIASELKHNYPNFDRDKFLYACGTS